MRLHVHPLAIKNVSSTALRANLSAVMDQANDDHEPVIVTRARGKPVVTASLEDRASMDETACLLSSPRSAERLLAGVRGFKAGEGVARPRPGMNLTFHQRGWEDYLRWQCPDRAMPRRLNAPIHERLRHPFEGAGKPVPLGGDLAGFRPRRIDREHRLVHRVTPTRLEIAQCRDHSQERSRVRLGMNADHAPEEVGQQFPVTRERTRQIEAKALRKLKHPSRSRKLRRFLDQ